MIQAQKISRGTKLEAKIKSLAIIKARESRESRALKSAYRLPLQISNWGRVRGLTKMPL